MGLYVDGRAGGRAGGWVEGRAGVWVWLDGSAGDGVGGSVGRHDASNGLTFAIKVKKSPLCVSSASNLVRCLDRLDF